MTEFSKNNEVNAGDVASSFPLPTRSSPGLEAIKEIDKVEEPAPFTSSDADAGNGYREMAFDSSCGTYQN